jgi:rhodanese-related sulfurtransferase
MMKIPLTNMSMRYLFIAQITLIICAVFLTECSGAELTNQAVLDSRLTIVDVRSFDEYKSGHIPGAISIPFWSVFTRHSDIPSAHDEPVVIYCENGPRAKLAKLCLRVVGFEQVVYLTGHMSSWRKAGLPIEKTVSPQ